MSRLLLILLVSSLGFGAYSPQEASRLIQRRTEALLSEINNPSTPLRLARAIGNLEENLVSNGMALKDWFGGLEESQFRCLAATIFSDPTLPAADGLAFAQALGLDRWGLTESTQKALRVQREAREQLLGYLNAVPGSLRELVRDFDRQKKGLDVSTLDALLGIERASREFSKVDPANYLGEEVYPQNWFDLASSTYDAAHRFYATTAPTSEDEVWDLGCGFGRILLYGAVLFPETQFRGVDIVEPRLEVIRNAVQTRNIKNLKVVNQNVLDTDFSTGTNFFLFAPFPKHMETVGNRLGGIGRTKRIRIMEFKTRFFQRYTEGENAWLRDRERNGYHHWESIPHP